MKLKTVVAAAVAAVAIAIPAWASVNAPAKAATPKKTELKADKSGPKKTVFDMSHAEIFSPVGDGPLNYTSFYEAIRMSGEEVGINNDPVTAKALKRVKTYIIAGPSRPFSAEEVKALKEFVKGGGNLLVMLHISGPVASVTSSFGILVTNFVIAERTDLIDGKSQDFIVSRFGAHPVTMGLEKVAVYGTWGLMAEEPGMVVAATSGRAWADMDRNRQFNEGEPVQEFGIVAVSELGKGKVVVVADDAPFANRFLPEADNRKLADNIIRWFK